MKSIFQAIFDDCIEIIGNEELQPETRMFAQVIAKNLLAYDAGTGVVIYSTEDRELVEGKIRLSGGGDPNDDVKGIEAFKR